MTSKANRARRRAADPWHATTGLWLALAWLGLWGARASLPPTFQPPTQQFPTEQFPTLEPLERLPPELWCDGRGIADVPLAEASARQLRALPGIGRGRARDLIEAGLRRGAPLELADWASLPGLGARTLAEVRRHLTGGGSSGLSRSAVGPTASRGP